MKIQLLTLTLFAVSPVLAQPKMIQEAVVSTTTNIIAPEEDELQNNQGGGGFNFRNMMDGEIKSTTYIKNELVKTVIKSEMGRSMIFRNNTTKLTTTLFEIMGTKQGFYVSDSEQTELRRKADSMMQSRRKTDTIAAAPAQRVEPVTEIVDAGQTKKIAGYSCKKTYLVTTRVLGLKDTIIVWYTPEIKIKNTVSTGGLSGFGSLGTINGLDKYDGFIMRFEMNMRRNRRMEVEVDKIEIGKEIADKEFDIPKDYEIKPMKDMQNFFGRQGMQRVN